MALHRTSSFKDYLRAVASEWVWAVLVIMFALVMWWVTAYLPA